ncbi:hypothetical protein pEaSNUABM50_00027 [Erwinia phage pEa_SNUABM_50]|uniref:Uncharacterized protein n=4 Tax=Eneladusvirus BF TaxID=2560751 RepID=A0A7L8ZMV7_9CAUD|nr:hypothetical protein FDH34_gp029 [Serratia phage BF]QOI70967.1 hypothetical protein pEaSNUABM12_00029 [Erwinia phage pEa_SNUABM_12]QOI71512.1 hypothetical protein pEaSNUABM47_00028 [Erwinia phage pEa_SNUABM_47]QOI72051.1 hypothetical protein pEaSNUABM50_00027 [Erwinia phage pEa_SNUABM_50]QXO11175.1 hypothetical protein pEaSNUABM19_00029 [Erwinia phage pEa_SNUABM_19]QXO11723.1 hypothetical protein pEaSNUABM44_00027 [Erwinia phage pEa_SNUABM_44]QXO12274.1 hypothetical protein pEaSNUABM49_000
MANFNAQNKVDRTPAHTLEVGTIVVHNYTTFCHGTITGYAPDGAYHVYFPTDMAPNMPKYQANTVEATQNRTRTLTAGSGFFVSKHKSFASIRELQRKYRQKGAALEMLA